MKKRLLSLVLCLVMVFSLLPMGSLAIERQDVQYVSVGTNWTTTTDYQSKANEGLPNDNGEKNLYYKEGDNYYKVSWDSSQNLYTVATQTNWKPADINGHYINAAANTSTPGNDELTFSAVSTKTGQMYQASSQTIFDDSVIDEGWHTHYQFYATRFFVKRATTEVSKDGGYTRMFAVSAGYPFDFDAWFYYFKDAKYNASNSVAVSNTTEVHKQTNYLAPKKSRINTNDYYPADSNRGTITIHGGNDGLSYTRGVTGAGSISTSASLRDFDETLYEAYTGKNSIWNGTAQLGSTVYDAGTNAWTGTLYTRNGTGTTTLTANGHNIGTPTAINGKTIYSGDLYVLKNAPLPQPSPTSIITTNETGEDGVYTHKDLTPNGDAYDITLTAYTTGNKVTTSTETITPTVKPMDIVMVIDQSGSMATQDMGNSFDNGTNKAWTIDEATGGVQYYYSPDGGLTHYPVHASTGYVYEKVDGSPRASDMLNSGDDAISLGVNGAPTYYNITTDYYVMHNGELHKLYLITAGLFLQYGLYPYIYTDNSDDYAKRAKWEANNYWVAVFDPWDGSDLRDDSHWNLLTNGGAASSRVSFVNTDGQAIGSTDANAGSARLSYSWFTSSDRISNLYQKSSTKVANQLYYIDSAGNRQNIGTTAQYAGDTVYEGKLYKATGTSRVDALKAAATEFANAVQQNALTNPEHPVDHRMAFVGFAGNKVPAYSLGSAATVVGSNGLKDYTNTGLFFNDGFENYEKITGFQSTSEQYINRHYYRNTNGTDGTPVRYSDGWYTLNLLTGARTATTAGNWSKAIYKGNGTSLSADDYRAALMSVNVNSQLNGAISDTINQFAANGGTYTSYGMSMAEQLYKALDDVNDIYGTDSQGTPNVERKRVIIVFTDGEPGANGYDSSIAGEALAAGNTVQLGKDGKAGTDDDVLIYTVGLFKSSPSSQVADFMKKLSSEYQMSLNPVYGGNDNDNYSLGSLDPNKTYYYKNDTTGKYYAVTTEYGTGSSLGWWIYNGSHSGTTESYSLTNPRRSTGAGTTPFYTASGSSVNGEDVKTGTTYYTSDGDKIVYEYRWFDSDRSIKNPALQSGQSTSAGETRVQFYDLAGAVANDDELSYYMTASNAAELNNVFAQIAGSLIEEETTVANGSAYTEDTMYVMDEISADFDLPSDLSASNNHVTVYADTVSEWNDDRSPKTYNISTTPLRQGNIDAIEAGNADVEVVWNGKKLQINYFDFGRMYMQESNPNAARIRVVIDGIKPNRAGDANVMSDLNPYVDNESGNANGALKSNTAQSGLYYKDPESGAVTLVEAFKVPSAPVPGYTVTWVNEQGTNMDNPYDQDTDLIKGDKPVYDGTEPTKDSVVEENVSRTDYTFDGWSTTPGGAKVISITRDAETDVVTSYGNFPPVVDHDVTYYAHFASEVKNFYTATWFNGTTQLFEQKGLANGDVPEYGGSIPSKNADDQYTYFFAGWYDEAAHTRNGETYVAADVITQLPAINGANVKYYAVFAPVQIETRNIILAYNTKTLIQGGTVTGFDAMNIPGGEFSLEKAENAASGDFFFTPGTQRNKQYNPAETGKYKFDVTGFAEVNSGVYYEGDKPTKVNVIPAADIYFDVDLSAKEAYLTKTVKSGDYKDEYRVDQSDIPAVTAVEQLAAGQYEITFTGTGIDIYCTTDKGGGYIQAKCEDQSQVVRNYDKDVTRFNVPSVSFAGLKDGTHTVTLNVLNSSNYRLDGIRVYNAMSDQQPYAATHEQYAAFINMREALVNNNTSTRITDTFTDQTTNEMARVLFVDDSSKLSEMRQATGKDENGNDVLYWELDENGNQKLDDDGNPIPRMVKVYDDQFDAYQANSPKHEIYLAAKDGNKTQAIVFQLSEAAETAAANGNLWIGLSAPDQNKNTGTVTLKEGKTIDVTSGVDMYYPITSDMIGADRVVTLTNTGDNMISVTNLKITGNKDIYDAAYEPKADTASVNEPLASTLSVEDAISMVFEPMTMRSVKIAANNGVDPDAVVEPEVPETPAPTTEPEVTPDPTPAPTETPAPVVTPEPTQAPSVHDIVKQIVSSFVNNLFRSISRLFGN